MKGCTKPNCDCIEKAMEANGGNQVKGYECLYAHNEAEELQNRFRIPELKKNKIIDGNKSAMPIPATPEFGLSIRAEFAARAMQGILASVLGASRISLEYAEAIARESVMCADVLIAELNKTTTS